MIVRRSWPLASCVLHKEPEHLTTTAACVQSLYLSALPTWNRLLKITNMSLCSLCLTVPWLSLSPPEKDLIVLRVGDKDDLLAVHYNRPADGALDSQAPQQPMGLPFHENLETLALSAKSCLLCGVIQNGVQAWINHWEEAAKNNKGFIEFDIRRYPIPTKQKLWITKCYGGAMGFYIWADHPEKKSLYMLTAVAFSVDRGMDQSYSYELVSLVTN